MSRVKRCKYVRQSRRSSETTFPAALTTNSTASDTIYVIEFCQCDVVLIEAYKFKYTKYYSSVLLHQNFFSRDTYPQAVYPKWAHEKSLSSINRSQLKRDNNKP